jgi:hypothetical protein
LVYPAAEKGVEGAMTLPDHPEQRCYGVVVGARRSGFDDLWHWMRGRSMDNRGRSARDVDLDTAELAQFGAVVLLIVGVTLIVLGRQRLIAEWLALGSGLPLAVAAVIVFWKAFGWKVAATQRVRDRRAASAEQEAGDAE